LSWLQYGSGHVSAIRFNRQQVSEFTRDRLHRETRRSQGARWQTRGYDSLGRRIRQQSAVTDGVALPEKDILSRAFRYCARGELAGIHDTLRGQVDYGYDAEGRLLKHYEARQGHASRGFRYDAADNLVDEEQGSVAVRDNRLRQWQQLFMKYDAWGNLIRRRSGQYEQHFTWDAENRLITASGSGPQGRFTAHYHYDALGRRTRKVVNSGPGEQETRFLWQGYRLLQEQQANGSRQTYVYDPAETWSPLARIDHQQDAAQGEIFWFSTDLNGAPLEVTDAEGAVRWSGQYGSFGEVSRQTEGFYRLSGQASLHHQPLRYAGQYADRETGLHYNLFRYYDPQVGRFTVQDPIGLKGGTNLYAYAPNPYSWIDPLGLSNCKPGIKELDPRDIRFSQSSVNGAADLTHSMKTKGWAGDPVDVVRMSDGKLTTIDNTRILAASRAGIKVQARIHEGSAPLPTEFIERFTTKKGVPSTWDEAIRLRIGKQVSGYKNGYPNGSDIIGSLD
jgi:RHS repeat-associated protein